MDIFYKYDITEKHCKYHIYTIIIFIINSYACQQVISKNVTSNSNFDEIQWRASPCL